MYRFPSTRGNTFLNKHDKHIGRLPSVHCLKGKTFLRLFFFNSLKKTCFWKLPLVFNTFWEKTVLFFSIMKKKKTNLTCYPWSRLVLNLVFTFSYHYVFLLMLGQSKTRWCSCCRFMWEIKNWLFKLLFKCE